MGINIKAPSAPGGLSRGQTSKPKSILKAGVLWSGHIFQSQHVSTSERLFSDLLRPTGTIGQCCNYSRTSDSPTVSQLLFSTVINAFGKYSFFRFRLAFLIWWRHFIDAGWGDDPTRSCSWSFS